MIDGVATFPVTVKGCLAFCCGNYWSTRSEEGHVEGHLDLSTWISSRKWVRFHASERLFPPQSLLCSGGFLRSILDPGRHGEPQGHAITECSLIGDNEHPLGKKIDYRKCNYF